ncbi:MAG TPA: glycoside hydrolase family 30 beta sandwich domain-containing protein [Polyangiaceae bacterium]|nr:glycoside hydrolase family 30 beta sandwich domain-containing protein [Polyangiaceae bacterium]
MIVRLSSSIALLISISSFVACSAEPGPDGGGVGGAPLDSGAGGTTSPGAGGAGTPGAGGNDAQGSGGNGVPGVGGSDFGTGGNDSATGGSDGTGGAAPIDELDFVTSAPNAYWKPGELEPATGSATITVNDGQVLGPWRGFGGTFNEKGWEAMKALSQADRDLAMQLLFDRANGAAFTHGRIPIGSSDYALNRYSLNETSGDFEMENFSLERDRRDLIPYIKAALAVRGDIHFWGSPWSPPTWMKTNNAFDRGNMKEDGDTLDAHALYLARFVEEYEKEGIIVEAIHPQNEPGYLQDYPSCGWSPDLMTKYIRDHLGPLFADRLPNTEIWLGTMSAPGDKNIVDTVMTTSAAANYVTGIGVQWGQDQYVGGYISSYQKPVMQTEHRCGNFPNGNNTTRAPNDDAYARESWGYIRTYINYGVSYYMAWNMVLDTAGRNLDEVRPWAQNALLAVDVNAKSLIITPTYYVFRHVAQYVDPGASRVAVQGGESLAWKNPDGDIVLVTYNGQGSPAEQTVAIGGSTYRITVPGQGWATVNFQAP